MGMVKRGMIREVVAKFAVIDLTMILRLLRQLGRGNMATDSGTIWSISSSLVTLVLFQFGGVPGSFALGYTKM